MSDTNNGGNREKKFNPTLSRAYEMKRGYWSTPLTTEDYDTIMKNVEVGGRLVLKINQHRTSDKSPDAYFEYVPASEVKAMEETRKANQRTQRDGASEDI